MKKNDVTTTSNVEKHAVLYVPFDTPLGVDQLETMNLKESPIGMFLYALFRTGIVSAQKHAHLPTLCSQGQRPPHCVQVRFWG